MYWISVILLFPYLFLLLKIYCGLRRIKPFTFRKHGSIFISVVIACRNEAANIKSLLNDIARQTYPSDKFEVIIADDNSTDETFNIALNFTGIKNLKVIKSTGQGKKTAIMTAVETAAGELIITTDGDCSTGSGWLDSIAAFYHHYEPDMIICPVTIRNTSGFLGRFQELEFLSLQGITAGSAVAGMSTMCNGANLAFTREAYLRHFANLRFDIPSGDDIFFLHSLKNEKGSAISWIESMDSLVTASAAENTCSFLDQRNRWISKAKAYSDSFTTTLAIVTFVTILTQAFLLIAGMILPGYLLAFIVVFLIKSVPDFLILLNTTGRYGRRSLMKWFLPSQLIYPFYVLSVVFLIVIKGRKGSV